jgi:hypothetical protein
VLKCNSHYTAALKSSKKANVFVDKRIGEYSEDRTAEQQNLQPDWSRNEAGDNKLSTRFTADGLIHINKDGVVVGKVGEDAKEASSPFS